MAAACLHVLLTAGVCLAGRRAVLPGTFDARGVASFASDGRVYLLQIAALERALKEDGAAAWLKTPAPAHVKLYSLSFALLSPLFGPTVLSAEPLNLIYYLTTLLLVFAVGREAFGEREGMLAAAVFAVVCPSFLLHTTQLLKDPLFVTLALALVLVSLKWLTTRYSLGRGLAAGAAGGALAGALWLVKHSAWPVVLAVMLTAAGLSAFEQARRRDFRAGNAAGVCLMLALALGATHFVKPYYLPKEYWMPHRPQAATMRTPAANDDESADEGGAGSADEVSTSSEAGGRDEARGFLARAVASVARARAGFVELYPDAASNLDADVRFAGAWDVVRYLPRAALVGLCAPFPSMWLGAGGQAGAAARLLAGGETLLMYFVQLLALRTLWRRRRETPVWLILIVAFVGATALGLVVVNVGALYRQRYLFWILFTVAGADTLARLLPERLARLVNSDGSHEGATGSAAD